MCWSNLFWSIFYLWSASKFTKYSSLNENNILPHAQFCKNNTLKGINVVIEKIYLLMMNLRTNYVITTLNNEFLNLLQNIIKFKAVITTNWKYLK